jgi:glycosyltransferase involved in cell wall biosynthesis
LRFAKLISDRGIKTLLYVYDNEGYPTLEKLRTDLDEAYPGHGIEITTDITRLPVGHIAVATTHQSVFSVLRAPPCSARFYLMQEFESLLYPGGTQAEQANATYQMGFKGICGGDWLKSIFESFGGKATKFDFAVDRGIFYSDRPVRDEVSRLFFFGRPSSERRMYDLGVAALQRIHEKYPNVEIVIAGLDGLKTLPFPATYLGNRTVAETGELYRTCDVGLTLSGSNLSYLPLELMASGVPVLTNRGPQVNWFCKHLENSYCAYPFASDFLRGFDALYQSKSLRERLVQDGFASVETTTWELEAEKIYTFISKEVGWAV